MLRQLDASVSWSPLPSHHLVFFYDYRFYVTPTILINMSVLPNLSRVHFIKTRENAYKR